MYVRDIGHPELVYGLYLEPFDEVWIDLKAMVAVGRGNPLFLCGSTRPAPLSHDPGNLLVVYDPAFAVQLLGNSSVPIARKFEAYISHTGP